MDEEQQRRAVRGADPQIEKAVRRIEELAARCEASNIYIAAQLTEVNVAWRDAIATSHPEAAADCAATFRDHAANSTGTRQKTFSEMTRMLASRYEKK